MKKKTKITMNLEGFKDLIDTFVNVIDMNEHYVVELSCQLSKENLDVPVLNYLTEKLEENCESSRWIANWLDKLFKKGKKS